MYPGIVQQQNLANTEEQLRRLLFGKGQEGVWFDPSDLSTMFQDVDGTIPVTADGDPVRLVLDKHRGLEQGPELVPDISTNGWAASGTSINQWIAESSNRISIDNTGGSGSCYWANDYLMQEGVTYVITFNVVSISSGPIGIRNGTDHEVFVNQTGVFSSVFKSQGVNPTRFAFRASPDAVAVIEDVSIKELPGNHYVYTDGSDNLYRTDGTLHWIETPTSYRYQFVVPAFSERASCFGAVSGTSSQYMSLASNNAATDGYIMVASAGVADRNLNHQVAYSQDGINRVNGSEFTGTRSDMYDVYNTGQKHIVGATGLDLNNIAGGVLKIGLQYATQSFDGGTWRGFIIWEGNNTIPIIEKVEQYLADKAGITLP